MKNNGLSDFLKFAYQCGKVEEIQKAFEEFPVEKEFHQGKIENLLTVAEENEEYSTYQIGDIVFVKKYSYQNGKEGNNHLFVIIDQNNIAVPIENFGMLISSKIDKVKYCANKLIEKNKSNGLNTDSIVKTDVVYKILNNQILFKIGTVEKENLEKYKASFIEINQKKDDLKM